MGFSADLLGTHVSHAYFAMEKMHAFRNLIFGVHLSRPTASFSLFNFFTAIDILLLISFIVSLLLVNNDPRYLKISHYFQFFGH
jgi:hypothetical protein